MNFNEISKSRYSCRKYDAERKVEDEKINAILNSAILSPSACNSQPYHITVCRGENAKEVARLTKQGPLNAFVEDASVMFVISEMPYSPRAERGAKLLNNDFRSIDIGILSAYIIAEATAQGLGSCILGCFDNEKIMSLCSLEGRVRLVISIGYPLDEAGEKKRKTTEELISFM